MRRSFMPFAAVYIAAGFGLAGCTPGGVSAQITNAVTAAQAVSASVCKFVPDFAVVLAIINANAGATASVVGNAICTALGSPPPAAARRGASSLVVVRGSGVVSGVRITGHAVGQ